MWTASATKRITAEGRKVVTITYLSDDPSQPQAVENIDVWAGMDDAAVDNAGAAGIARLVAQDEAYAKLSEGNLSDRIAKTQAAAQAAAEIIREA